MNEIIIYTIGFTKKSAQDFFRSITDAGVKKLVDIRLNNASQLAGFAKRDDLAYFLKELCNCDYLHEPLLAPTQQILDAYKKGGIDWIEYESRFNALIRDRKIENRFNTSELDMSCFLCSEPTPDKCHRRLVSEYLKRKLGNIIIQHL
ncbi:MAG: DUF488 domain-containing protein [Deltaproteobacteria bacterium]|nr:DUF488 domain-containing protein [Deltaproteobacteria bacterium]